MRTEGAYEVRMLAATLRASGVRPLVRPSRGVNNQPLQALSARTLTINKLPSIITQQDRHQIAIIMVETGVGVEADHRREGPVGEEKVAISEKEGKETVIGNIGVKGVIETVIGRKTGKKNTEKEIESIGAIETETEKRRETGNGIGIGIEISIEIKSIFNNLESHQKTSNLSLNLLAQTPVPENVNGIET